MSAERWSALWEIAADTDEGPAAIHPDPSDSGRVSLVWPDRSVTDLRWDDDGDCWRSDAGADLASPDRAHGAS